MTLPQDERADIETASEGYAQRFAGPAGEWLLNVQTRLLLDLLQPYPAATVLDVGGGHAQAAFPLAEAGYKVTVLGSDPICAARLQPLLDAGRAEFVTGTVTALPYPDNAFDVVVSLRLVPHCEQWPVLLQECCRVARRAVVVDYPCVESVNCLAGLFFARKRKMEGNTRTWITFKHRQIRDAFTAAGWGDVTSRKQFFWPMVLHRKLNKPGLSRALESSTAMLGLRRALGSPVLIRARPGNSSAT